MNINADPVFDTFVRAAEVWIPQGDKLVHAEGDYAHSPAFAEASVAESFARGEGLPGKVWESGKPIVLKEFDGSYFKRAEAAAEAGLTSAVAIPVFAGNELKAVLVLFCSADADHMGAIEVWEYLNERLTLADGYYGGATEFEAASRDISFSHGQGLPGGVWSANTPILKRDIARAGSFLRSEQAAAIGLKTGLGLPIPTPGDNVVVLTLLSALNTPIAHRFEIWDARPECVGATRQAQLIDGLCKREGALWAQQNPPVDPPMAQAWKGPVGKVLGTGLPYVQREGAGLPAGYTSMFALPIYHEADLAYVVACYL
ncbi:GAF domain-containing protein [Granulosicoccus sp. 3-233]|uniref:GAF domain-containing protein n=1 Tax=Granulosicoccus sp. 3-233 TaxID=3417969 RepID=UPI003D33995F